MALAQALNVSTALRNLHLSSTSIGGEGGEQHAVWRLELGCRGRDLAQLRAERVRARDAADTVFVGTARGASVESPAWSGDLGTWFGGK